MKNYSKYLMLFFATSLLAISCYEDKGNYDYKNRPEIIVESDFLSKKVAFKQYDNLIIEPTVKQEGNSNFSYKWTLKSCRPDIMTGKYVDVLIGETKDVNYKLKEEPGDYFLYFEVTDKSNNTIKFVKFDIVILSFAQQGLMIIHGDENGCDVSILANSDVNPDWATDVLQHEVYSITNGKRIEGEALGVKYISMIHSPYVFTTKGGSRLGGNALDILTPYNEMFMMPIENQKYEGYDINGYNELLCNDGAIYWCQQSSVSIYKKFDISVFGLDYKAAPYFGTQGMSWMYFGLFYDQLNLRFLGIKNGSVAAEPKDYSPAGGFNMRRVGKNLIYAEHGYGSKFYCIMQDVDAVKRHLYICNMKGTDNDVFGEVAQSLENAENINDAKYFTFGSRGNVMYYATDHTIYLYDYNNNKTSTSLINLNDLGYAGYNISVMRLYKNTYTDFKVLDSKTLFVAIYNDSNKEGKLLSFAVNETTGDINLASKKEYSGFGKIKDFNYKYK